MVADGIDDSVESVNSIATITSQLTTVRKNVIDLITSLSAVSEENAASTEETSAASAELTSAMNNVEEEISVLQKLAEDLAKSIKIFKL
jgi:methyl-accepting chemotaxis protein